MWVGSLATAAGAYAEGNAECGPASRVVFAPAAQDGPCLNGRPPPPQAEAATGPSGKLG